jgi:multicomponent Na+:H+ antiporter subunit D
MTPVASVALPVLVPLVGGLVCLPLRSCRALAVALAVVAAEVALLGFGLASGPTRDVAVLGVDLALSQDGRILLLVACAVVAIVVLASVEDPTETAMATAALGGLAAAALATVASATLLAAGPALSLTGLTLLGGLLRQPASPGLLQGARRYLVWITVGGAALTFSGAIDVLSAQPARFAAAPPPLYGPIAALFVVGIGIGVAALPFWPWLPALGEQAPRVGALAAGLMGTASAGILVGALTSTPWLLDQGSARLILPTVGGLAALASVVVALGSKDPAQVLAYVLGANADLALGGLAASPTGDLATATWSLGVQALAGALGLASLAGLGCATGGFWRRPILGVALAVAGLSLVGFPPTAGFVARVLLARIVPQPAALVVLAGAASAIGGLALLRVFLPLFAPPSGAREPIRPFDLGALALAALLLLGGIVPGPVLDLLR